MRMTKNRQAIYDVLENSTMPLTAQEIHDIIRAKGEEVWISTIYRNLEIFEENKLVIKADIPNSDQYHYILADGDHRHYAICLSCKKITEDLPCPMHDYEDELEEKGFKVVDHKFIVYGYCPNCL